MSQHHLLDVIEVAKPCLADWDQMKGIDQRRFCGHCSKWVHNLSAMPLEQVERLLCESAGELCVRLTRSACSGQLLTLEYQAAPKRSRKATLVAISAAVIAAITLGAIRIRPFQPTVVMGAAPLPRIPSTLPTSAPAVTPR